MMAGEVKRQTHCRQTAAMAPVCRDMKSDVSTCRLSWRCPPSARYCRRLQTVEASSRGGVDSAEGSRQEELPSERMGKGAAPGGVEGVYGAVAGASAELVMEMRRRAMPAI